MRRKSVFSPQYDALKRFLMDARQKAKLTQAELADKLKRPQSYVSKYEHGERRLDVVELLEVLDVLGAKPADLLAAIRNGTES